jgi:hypothetical protein
MTARISIDIDAQPDATIVAAPGITATGIRISIWDGECHTVWLNPTQALTLHRSLGDVLMAMNVVITEPVSAWADRQIKPVSS